MLKPYPKYRKLRYTASGIGFIKDYISIKKYNNFQDITLQCDVADPSWNCLF